jgi:hypothetical protein
MEVALFAALIAPIFLLAVFMLDLLVDFYASANLKRAAAVAGMPNKLLQSTDNLIRYPELKVLPRVTSW